MRDPHVERLHFEVSCGEGLSYKDPPSYSFNNRLGDFLLQDGRLTFEPTAHFTSEDTARAIVEPFLRAWEIDTDLDGNIGKIRFKYLNADLIDRDPPKPGEGIVLSVKPGQVVWYAPDIHAHFTMRRYPPAPETFNTTPDVHVAYQRWVQYKEGKEPLLSMAYFILTFLERVVGERCVMSEKLKVEMKVLGTLGKLCSTRGDSLSARKEAKSHTQLEPLTGTEAGWVDQVVRRLIKRLGEQNLKPSMIKVTDFPSL